MKQESLALNLVTIFLRVALLLALVGAGWSIYRYLPKDDPETAGREASTAVDTELEIIMRVPPGDRATLPSVLLQLYPIDITAAQNEFFSERRPGKRLDDFLAERMGSRSPVEARLDERGRATAKVKPGPWWIHATLPGELNIEWRLRVNVSGRKQTVEMTPDNAYTRTKSF